VDREASGALSVRCPQPIYGLEQLAGFVRIHTIRCRGESPPARTANHMSQPRSVPPFHRRYGLSQRDCGPIVRPKSEDLEYSCQDNSRAPQTSATSVAETVSGASARVSCGRTGVSACPVAALDWFTLDRQRRLSTATAADDQNQNATSLRCTRTISIKSASGITPDG
jgi:hypothetical protein